MTKMQTPDLFQAISTFWPILVAFIGVIVVLAKMDSDVKVLKNKVETLFTLWNTRDK